MDPSARHTLVTGGRSAREYVSQEILAVGRPGDAVRAVLLGECDQSGPVEVDSAELQEIRILVGVHAAGEEPDLALLLIDTLDAAHHPRSFGDLTLQDALLAVVQIEVVPSASFGCPQYFLAVPHGVQVVLVVVVNEGLGVLVYQSPNLAAEGVHLDDPTALVATVALLEHERVLVVLPAQPGWTAEVDRLDLGGPALLGRDREDEHLVRRKTVAGPRIGPGAQLGFELIVGGCLDQVDILHVPGNDAVGDQVLRVGGPGRRAVVRILAPVVAERKLAVVGG